MKTKIDRYHVPLIIYSPLLKQPAQFESISTHFDVTPSVVSLLKNRYHIETPSLVSWLGSGLDTSRAFRNIHAYPFMQTKTEIIDFIAENKMLNDDDLFRISSTMDLEFDNNPVMAYKMRRSFDSFKQQNQQVINGAKLIPDSIYAKYAH